MPLSDILSCPESDLEAIITSEQPYSSGDWYFAKNIGAIQLRLLGEVLGVGSYEELESGFRLVGEPLPEGPWPRTIHAGLVDKIRKLSDTETEKASIEWAKAEELDGAPPDNLADYLTGLREFFAKNHGPVFLIEAL